jgi:predicted O-methyltransferase YrrM
VININQFRMDEGEQQFLKVLLSKANPRRIAEFGSGLSTRFWAINCDAAIVTWDNYEEWLQELRTTFANEPWIERVEWRSYVVTPEGPRNVEKDPVPWDGEKFDFLFLDGPRSAHPPNFGRSGSFRFATLHAEEGATIVWHDAQRPHEREMARRYFGHCRRRRDKTVGWCKWEKPNGGLRQFLNRLNPFA